MYLIPQTCTLKMVNFMCVFYHNLKKSLLKISDERKGQIVWEGASGLPEKAPVLAVNNLIG